jgi:ligand-binding sensor domain-containing protein
MLSVENTRIITNPSNSDQVLQNTRSWTNGEFTNFNTTDRLPSNNIRDLLWDSGNNRLFIATNKGLAIFNTNNRSFITKNVSDGMLRDDINSLAFDSERNVLYLGAFDCLSFYDITNDTFTNKDMGSTWQTPPRVLAFNPLRNDLYIGLRSVSL